MLLINSSCNTVLTWVSLCQTFIHYDQTTTYFLPQKQIQSSMYQDFVLAMHRKSAKMLFEIIIMIDFKVIFI
jgi:hypothetical protein